MQHCRWPFLYRHYFKNYDCAFLLPLQELLLYKRGADVSTIKGVWGGMLLAWVSKK